VNVFLRIAAHGVRGPYSLETQDGLQMYEIRIHARIGESSGFIPGVAADVRAVASTAGRA
jgi:hypothetical protein